MHLFQVKKFNCVELGVLCLQASTNSHFHFFSIEEYVTFQVLLQRLMVMRTGLQARWPENRMCNINVIS
jgi:hypothetical protein